MYYKMLVLRERTFCSRSMLHVYNLS